MTVKNCGQRASKILKESLKDFRQGSFEYFRHPTSSGEETTVYLSTMSSVGVMANGTQRKMTNHGGEVEALNGTRPSCLALRMRWGVESTQKNPAENL